MIRVLLAMCFGGVLAQAQLVLSPAGTITLPAIYATDTYDLKINLVNTGAQSVTLATLSIAGTAFTLPDRPPTPRQIAVGESLAFTVRFAPLDPGSFSGVLQAGTLASFVIGRSVAGATLFASEKAVHLPDGIDFGILEPGVAVSRRFSLRNLLKQPVTTASLSVAGDFRLSTGTAGPFTLAPGATVDFEIEAQAAREGVVAGTLVVDDRRFPLTARALIPPLPKPAIVFRDAAVTSAQQSRLSISLAEPARAAGAGSVEFAFELLTNGLAGDPGVLFPASGTRSLNFTVEKGDTTARFGSLNYAEFQTGTTAGNLVLRIRFGDFLETAALAIAPEKIGVDRLRATRTGKGVDVEATGFDNTRSASKLAFTFYARDGRAVSFGAINVDATDSFRAYFATAALGGMFSLKASFPVTGSPDEIDSVEMELVNSQGNTRTERVKF
ncbi:MAG: choice-of-anchor D domain-containing protein [Acidobacteriota bacterium]|nr:choice-of-anchor D domain-containing protein [Acidobacteriota bacterium]